MSPEIGRSATLSRDLGPLPVRKNSRFPASWIVCLFLILALVGSLWYFSLL